MKTYTHCSYVTYIIRVYMITLKHSIRVATFTGDVFCMSYKRNTQCTLFYCGGLPYNLIHVDSPVVSVKP